MVDKWRVYRAARGRWGDQGQTTVLIEECAELIAAMAQYKNGKRPVEAVIEELADVEIMLEQMHLYFDYSRVQSVKKEKIDRLAGILHVFDESKYPAYETPKP